jgi:hypothetical protein
MPAPQPPTWIHRNATAALRFHADQAESRVIAISQCDFAAIRAALTLPALA